MNRLLKDIRACRVCEPCLAHGVRPIVSASKDSRLVIIGQAPGAKVHKSGIPWDDASGRKLREWLGISDSDFYDASKVALVPMGFCYPGKGKSGDLPPRPECAPLWHDRLIKRLNSAKLTLLVGQYAQNYYLSQFDSLNLTDRVANFEKYAPSFFPLPHPSPRNGFWLRRNPWFEERVLPKLKERVQRELS